MEESIRLIEGGLEERNSQRRGGAAPAKAAKVRLNVKTQPPKQKEQQKETTHPAHPKPQPYSKGPHFTVERTRNCVQCRTGLKGKGQYHRIAFGSGGEAAAVKKAQAWVAEQKRRSN